VVLPHNKIEFWLESGFGCTSPILGKIGGNTSRIVVQPTLSTCMAAAQTIPVNKSV
jgi:hypothetical protein